ncbi:MAG TPA: anaerobic ribonucleoside-triphosphate reductase [Nitrososphaerales archaeon]
MSSSAKRVRNIYSVIASSNRLEVLRILNSKGPLSYSELKTLSGFKSKKESGKFAYHLRKLVRNMIVSLNRSERRYQVTNLGRLILNLTREIEEQSVIESGKLFVRTSKQTMEEFNPDKILQSLVKEAGMPLELAQKITSEAESRLYKFQTSYLTSPLIREIVNAILIEHGHQVYRDKLTRLGLPVYDITELINKTAKGSEGLEALTAQTARAIFSEYLLLDQLPRDVADAHLSGDIHISNVGSWGLMPDTVFIDLSLTPSSGVDLGGKMFSYPRISAPSKITDALSSICLLSSLLAREVSEEVSMDNFLGYVAKYNDGRSQDELTDFVAQAFRMMPSGSVDGVSKPVVSIRMSVQEEDAPEPAKVQKAKKAIFAAYKDYVQAVPIPRVKLIVSLDEGNVGEDIRAASEIAKLGGFVAISASGSSNAYSGINRYLDSKNASNKGTSVLHSLAVNMPRLAYESNKDETYFRAKLVMKLQTAIGALMARKAIIEDISRKGLLQTLAKTSAISPTEPMPLIVNMTGLAESITSITAEKPYTKSGKALAEKIIETATKISRQKGDELGADFGISVVSDDSGARFAAPDAERFGKGIVVTQTKGAYSQVPEIEANDLLNDELMDAMETYRRFDGGHAFILRVDKAPSVEKIAEIAKIAMKNLDYVKLGLMLSVCRACGKKHSGEINRCTNCKSSSIMIVPTR